MTNFQKQVKTLTEMLTYRRPHGTVTENLFITRYIANLPDAYQDACRNWHVHVPKKSGEDVRVLFSCHTDTVSCREGRQDVVATKDGMISLTRKAKKRSNCLGADDTVGVFLCREMILAGVPGHYIFHFGEEVGGIGSGDLARTMPGLLAGYNYAIAFDRRGTRDIITHQGGRCASDKFAKAFADQLNAIEPLFVYKPSDAGIYTDTAEYTHLIPECTNISVGYYDEHSSAERVDAVHVMTLLSALRRVDFDILPVDRDVNDVEDDFDYLFARHAVTSVKMKENLDDKWERLFKDTSVNTPTGSIWKWTTPTRPRAAGLRKSSQRIAPEYKSSNYYGKPEYLDPEWEEVQRTLLNMELRNKLTH